MDQKDDESEISWSSIETESLDSDDEPNTTSVPHKEHRRASDILDGWRAGAPVEVGDYLGWKMGLLGH